MKKLLMVIAFLCLFFFSYDKVSADIYASASKCESRVLDGIQATQTCPIEFTVTDRSINVFRVTVTVNLVAMNNPTYSVSVTDSNWRLVKQEGNVFVIETSLSSLPSNSLL